MDDNKETTMDEKKVEVLLNQFSTVFTIEQDWEIPRLKDINVAHEYGNLMITEDMVRQKLHSINTTKSAGPDRIHSRMYMEIYEELTTLLTPYTTVWSRKNLSPRPGNWPVYHRSTRKAARNAEVTTAQWAWLQLHPRSWNPSSGTISSAIWQGMFDSAKSSLASLGRPQSYNYWGPLIKGWVTG